MMKKICAAIILIVSAAVLTGCSEEINLESAEREIKNSYGDNTLESVLGQMDEAYQPLKDKLDYIYDTIDSAKWR
ncbi:MAG: hypothetical protein ACLRQ0_10755 [Monoglobales bacterium]